MRPSLSPMRSVSTFFFVLGYCFVSKRYSEDTPYLCCLCFLHGLTGNVYVCLLDSAYTEVDTRPHLLKLYSGKPSAASLCANKVDSNVHLRINTRIGRFA